MKIGYACINETIPGSFRTCRLATMRTEGMDKIKELTIHNFTKTIEILKWNAENNIFFYRLTSEMIPLATHPEMTWEWWGDDDVIQLTDEIKSFKRLHKMRLSVHPGQYSVLNSPKREIVDRAVEDLEYHDKMLNLIDGDDMILHVGGAYGNKPEAMERYIQNYNELSDSIKRRLRVENDDKTFNLEEVIEISDRSGVPICFDIHHHRCNLSDKPLEELLEDVFASWRGFGVPKIHISTGRDSGTDRSHHNYVSDKDFDELMHLLKDKEADVMFETKKKELSVLQQMERLGKIQ